jgi:hypothetical protein
LTEKTAGPPRASAIQGTITERTVVTATAYCANCMGMLHRKSADAPWLHLSSGSDVCSEAMVQVVQGGEPS